MCPTNLESPLCTVSEISLDFAINKAHIVINKITRIVLGQRYSLPVSGVVVSDVAQIALHFSDDDVLQEQK